MDLARNLIGRINLGDSPTRSAAARAAKLAVVNGERRFKVPKSAVFVGQLPKTSTGKIQKNVVRSEHARHYQDEEG
jgi:acyl-coenzyme A synthetase/AMP-(fatty) acid ligase